MFSKSQRYYDVIYSGKDYAQEAAHVKWLIVEHKRSDGNALLDIACGTGGHVPYLRDDFAYEGLDLDPVMLALARERFPDVPFHLVHDQLALSRTGSGSMRCGSWAQP
jgi:ubiquinone/menaquinone biosynthesis C-methylase UbiE